MGSVGELVGRKGRLAGMDMTERAKGETLETLVTGRCVRPRRGQAGESVQGSGIVGRQLD